MKTVKLKSRATDTIGTPRMGNTFEAQESDWSRILDELRQKESLGSDAKLAVALGVTKGYICSVRKGRKQVSFDLAKVIFSRLGRTHEVEKFEKLFIPKKVVAHTRALKILRQSVISRADGRCQLCDAVAPFQLSDGSPYLELHKVEPLDKEGGKSSRSFVALCPNCNRKMSIAPASADLEKLKAIIKDYQ